MTRRPLAPPAVFVGLLLLTGCSGLPFFGDDEPETEAERLLRPPNILSGDGAGGEPVAGGDGGDDRVRVEARSDDRDPTELLDRAGGEPVLDSGLPPDVAWRVTGRILQRSAFAVEARDAQARAYTLRYDAAEGPEEEDGFFASLAFWRDDPVPPVGRYRLEVAPRGDGSRLRLRTADGDPANPGVARQVLSVLAERLRP
ncbi:outer membrane protein assembly factor BamC [Spiribacter halobius]|uniref:Outer membrane protein assembly factor BamC n=1 Tax=Sediminicurvatus halobius TaxID=2182432 RepID=A0A2U2MVZ7_9GAMM|nr:outer membrane protein assembly factor BamC [Spiribacter halobius]PWG61037.1 hypothetical protein DEM34_18470 [Spiribacter halobius]UEX78660.1 outer membrane protein assembly factor BamC [Spiribacter halobius]